MGVRDGPAEYAVRGPQEDAFTIQPNPIDPVASERLSYAGKVFTSDLSINESALLQGAGFEPVE